MVEVRNSYILVGRGHLEDIGIDGKLILKWILRKWDGWVLTGFMCLRQGPVESCCEHGNAYFGSIKIGEFFD
jgi:hypothetical protein